MLTKSTKTVVVTEEKQVDVYTLELTKDQAIELAAILGNFCSRADGVFWQFSELGLTNANPKYRKISEEILKAFKFSPVTNYL